jgi:hypothetical protein
MPRRIEAASECQRWNPGEEEHLKGYLPFFTLAASLPSQPAKQTSD